MSGLNLGKINDYEHCRLWMMHLDHSEDLPYWGLSGWSKILRFERFPFC